MDWLAALTGKLPRGLAGWPALGAHLAAMAPAEARAVVKDMLDAWIWGGLDVGEWERMTGIAEAPLAHIHVLWDRLVEIGLAPSHIDCGATVDDAVARRWAWTPRWTLMEQDEDLLLFGSERALLGAVGPGCPKSPYVIEVVTHAVRDAAHDTVTSLQPRGARNGLALAAELIPLAEARGMEELVAYLMRLDSYRKPSRVDRAGAIARGMDLHRCHPPHPDAMIVRAVGVQWHIRWTTPYGSSGLSVHQRFGRMAPLDPVR